MPRSLPLLRRGHAFLLQPLKMNHNYSTLSSRSKMTTNPRWRRPYENISWAIEILSPRPLFDTRSPRSLDVPSFLCHLRFSSLSPSRRSVCLTVLLIRAGFQPTPPSTWDTINFLQTYLELRVPATGNSSVCPCFRINQKRV